MRTGNNFSQVCLHVCLSVGAIAFETLQPGILFQYTDASWPYLGQVEYQGHWVKVKFK